MFRIDSLKSCDSTFDPPDEPQRRNGVGGTHRQHLSPVRAAIQQFQQGTQGTLSAYCPVPNSNLEPKTTIAIASMLKQTMRECPKMAPSTPSSFFCLRLPKPDRLDSSPFCSQQLGELHHCRCLNQFQHVICVLIGYISSGLLPNFLRVPRAGKLNLQLG
jgi:hypothetical protein